MDALDSAALVEPGSAGEKSRLADRAARICSDCPAALGPKNVSGRCKPCATRKNNLDPVLAEKRRQGILRKFQEPEHRAHHQARCVAMNRSISDEVREKRRQHGFKMVDILLAANQAITPEQRAEAGRKRSETVLAWCPAEWRDKYRELCRRGRPAAVAKRMVLDMIAGRPLPIPYSKQRAQLAWCPPARRAEYDQVRNMYGAAEARRIIEADLTPFERQMARIAAGAQLVDAPDTRRSGPSYTLGGISTGMI